MQVLRPEQSAILLVAAYPSNIDSLAVANLLAYRKGLAEDPVADEDNSPSQNPLTPTTSLAILAEH